MLSDALLSVEVVNGSDLDGSYFGLIASDGKTILSSLSCVSVVHNNKATNIFAHRLAKTALFLHDYQVWGRPFDYFVISALYSAFLLD